MGNYQIERQVELLEDARSIIIQHSQLLDNAMTMFRSGVNSLEQDDLNHDYMDFLEGFLAEYSSKLKSLRDTIDEEYIPALNRKIRHLEERD